MDAISTGWSVFTTCYSAYQIVSEAIELNSDSVLWSVQTRVERVRFEVWGRTLGFLDEKTGAPKDLDKEDLTVSNGGLSDIVQIETANQLIRDLLKAITAALNEFQKTAEKYSLEKKNVEPTATSTTSRRLRALAGFSKAWSETKVFTKHVVYILVDKGLVEQLVQKLSGLNDSLEKLLTLPQKVQYAKAVSSGVLVKYQRPDELGSLIEALDDDSGQKSTQSDPGILKASARVKQLCVRMDSHEPAERAAAPGPGSFKLGTELVRGYPAPTKKHRDDPHWPFGVANYTTGAEPTRRVLVEWRDAKPSSPRFIIENTELVRRRDAIAQLLHRTSTMTGADDYRLLECVGYIETTTTDGSDDPDAPAVNVVGFVSLFPSWADEHSEPITLHSLLQNAFDREVPVLTGGNNDSTSIVPALGTRFALARDLSNALYQLQCSNWVHRNLSSHQVVFFRDSTSGNVLRLDRPFLIGFQYSRPDDNMNSNNGPTPVNLFSEGFGHSLKSSAAFPELYLPPEFSVFSSDGVSSGALGPAGLSLRRYRRSDDVYSLGVMLLEIGFWEPVNAFHHNNQASHDGSRDATEKAPTVQDTARKVLTAAAAELPSEVGALYADAVLRCLRGLRQGEVTQASSAIDDSGVATEGEGTPVYDGQYHGEDPEFALEVDFLWKVLREIEKCRV
ncbi:prion-inhibition and propagation-domain-containing protein [Chaetomium sp. MPI-SDFR-AT-0129]|nr:prion-inhibition and propagation-domain-containing protein [Chaetomium sp. MPI-SDFR-AT-0129]